MAATNYTPIQLYYSTTASAAPTSGNLANGELAINITDGKLYYKDNGGVVQVIATKGAGSIGGSTTQIQYNNAGALAGNAAMTFNSGTNVTTLTTLNLTNALGATYGGTAQSAYAQGDVLYASATNTLSKLGIGTANYILTSSGSVPQWVAPTSITVNTATNLAGGAAGSVPYQSGVATTTFLAIGAANTVMTSSGIAPQWGTTLTGLTGLSSSSITNTSLTSGRVVVSSTAGLEADSANLTFDGTTLSSTGYSTTGLSTLVKTVKIGDSNFSGVAVFAAATPAKLYIGTGTVTDNTSAIGATNAVGAVSSLAITPIAATNTSVTYTNASTLYIAGAPSAGTNITITNPYSLYIAAGAAYFGGTTSHIGAATFTTDITVNGLTVGRGAGAVASNTAVGASALAANTTGAENVAVGNRSVESNLTGTDITAVGFRAARLTTVGNITAFGAYALDGNTTGAYNTALGVSALQSNTTASNNTAVGYQAAYTNVTGTRLVAIGKAALYANTGSYSVAVGYNALTANTTGVNVAVGDSTLAANTTGTLNVAIGSFDGSALPPLYSNTTGSYNVAIGGTALKSNTTASSNTAIGVSALFSNTTADNNTAVGYQAGYSNTTATEITAIGRGALYSNTTGGSNTAVGLESLTTNTTGSGNTAIGVASNKLNTTGINNASLGQYALLFNTTGGSNTAIGSGALYSNTTASNNTAVGYQSGYSNTTGATNAFFGYQAGYNNIAGVGNTFIGMQSGSSHNTAGNTYNTFLGYYSGYSTTGTLNTFLGEESGQTITTGSKNTIIGRYNGNQGSLDIRTASNYIVLSDGDGNPRGIFDATGNFGLGVTPSAWGSGYKAIQLPTGTYGGGSFITDNGSPAIASNAYNNAGWKYVGSDYATIYQSRSGQHQWFNAPSGTAGASATVTSGQLYTVSVLGSSTLAQWQAFFSALSVLPTVGQVVTATATGSIVGGGTVTQIITFTQAMTLDASGNLGIGVTSPSYKLHVSSTGSNIVGSEGTTDASFITRLSGTQGLYLHSTTALSEINELRNLPLLFSTNATERARIDSSGNLLVGTTTSTGANGFVANMNGGTGGAYTNTNHPTGAVSGVAYAQYLYNSAVIGSITQSGTTAVLYNVTSDQRLKENIVDAPEFGSVIDSLQVRSFDWKTDNTHQRAGFIAQELVTVAPEAVHQPADPEDMMAVDYSKLVPMLVKEIQDLRKRLAALEAK